LQLTAKSDEIKKSRADLANQKTALEARHAEQLAELEKVKVTHEKNLEAARQELEEERAALKAKAAHFLELAGAA